MCPQVIKRGEDLLWAAKRELLEETGYKAKRWVFIGSYFVESRKGCGRLIFIWQRN
jgi:8-oxo-dGTP pyrophosphatase MutT (NUDIX family)